MSTTSQKTSINEKITKLNQQIDWFYSDDFSLDSAVENYQTAIKLAADIENDLKSLKNDIHILSEDFSKK